MKNNSKKYFHGMPRATRIYLVENLLHSATTLSKTFSEIHGSFILVVGETTRFIHRQQ